MKQKLDIDKTSNRRQGAWTIIDVRLMLFQGTMLFSMS